MIEITTGVLFLLGTFYGNVPTTAMESAGAVSVPKQYVLVDQPLTLEEYVREYFKDTPIMAEIAKCESHFRHLGANGKVLRGELTAEDTGVMQINEFYHEDTAKTLGIDLHTLDGNLAYAKWLYKKEGTTPWYSSAKCWQKSDTLARGNPSMDSSGLAKATAKTATN
ncbi:MAG: hypothetical protein EXS51_01820 [Candidatus Taylorbacteria bacterium]|nr:hypothetical protein [Candidatus Taylorbacteria bacterium]